MMKSTSGVKDQKAMYSSNLLSGLTLTLRDLPFNSSCCSNLIVYYIPRIPRYEETPPLRSSHVNWF